MKIIHNYDDDDDDDFLDTSDISDQKMLHGYSVCQVALNPFPPFSVKWFVQFLYFDTSTFGPNDKIFQCVPMMMCSRRNVSIHNMYCRGHLFPWKHLCIFVWAAGLAAQVFQVLAHSCGSTSAVAGPQDLKSKKWPKNPKKSPTNPKKSPTNPKNSLRNSKNQVLAHSWGHIRCRRTTDDALKLPIWYASRRCKYLFKENILWKENIICAYFANAAVAWVSLKLSTLLQLKFHLRRWRSPDVTQAVSTVCIAMFLLWPLQCIGGEWALD